MLKAEYSWEQFRKTTDCRSDKIYVAEKVIVPEHGRKYFAHGCLNQVFDETFSVIFSTIRAEREVLIGSCLDKNMRVLGINLESSDDARNVDTNRSLIDESEGIKFVNLFNDKENPQILFNQFSVTVSYLNLL